MMSFKSLLLQVFAVLALSSAWRRPDDLPSGRVEVLCLLFAAAKPM
jgi:hypothetical protein